MGLARRRAKGMTSVGRELPQIGSGENSDVAAKRVAANWVTEDRGVAIQLSRTETLRA